MFGYVNVYKDELKIKDYDIYRAYYCGLCKMLGKKHNQLVRLSLNYDLTFLAILIDAMTSESFEMTMSGCLKKLGKKKIVSKAKGLEFSADMNVILAYYKLKDDISDGFSLKALISIIPFLRRAGLIKKKYPDLCKTISDSLLRLKFLEETKCDVIDKAAHEFAVIMQSMFETADINLSELGYSLGRLIYIMDAYDDIESDFIKKNYNPAVIQYGYKGEFTSEILKSMSDNLYITLGHMSEIYENLKIIKNKPVLDNIIYLGMRAKCDFIINKCKTGKEYSNEKSL